MRVGDVEKQVFSVEETAEAGGAASAQAFLSRVSAPLINTTTQ